MKAVLVLALPHWVVNGTSDAPWAQLDKEAHRCGVEFRLLRTKSMKHFFVQVGCDAKYQVAQLIAELFKEISWRARPKR